MTSNVTFLSSERRGDFPKEWLDSPFSDYMEVAFKATPEGGEYGLEFNDKFIGNPSLRAFHGGIVATFIESVAQMHLFQERQQAYFQTPETVTIDYLRPALSSALIAIPKVVRIGRNVSTIAVDVMQNSKVVAKGRVIFTG